MTLFKKKDYYYDAIISVSDPFWFLVQQPHWPSHTFLKHKKKSELFTQFNTLAQLTSTMLSFWNGSLTIPHCFLPNAKGMGGQVTIRVNLLP